MWMTATFALVVVMVRLYLFPLSGMFGSSGFSSTSLKMWSFNPLTLASLFLSQHGIQSRYRVEL